MGSFNRTTTALAIILFAVPYYHDSAASGFVPPQLSRSARNDVIGGGITSETPSTIGRNSRDEPIVPPSSIKPTTTRLFSTPDTQQHEDETTTSSKTASSSSSSWDPSDAFVDDSSPLPEILGDNNIIHNGHEEKSVVVPTVIEYERLLSEKESLATDLESSETEIRRLKSEIVEKSAAIRANRDKWSDEKTGLVARIAEFTSLLQDQEERDRQAMLDEVEREEYREEQDRLGREVKLLQTQIVAVQNRYKEEQAKSYELQNRFADAEDRLEFEQMQFRKEKKDLQENLQQQQSLLDEAKHQLEKEQNTFQKETNALQQQLQKETQRLEDAKGKWTATEAEFQRGRAVLRDKVREQKRALDAVQATLEQEREQHQRDKQSLEAQIQHEQQRLKQMTHDFQQEKERFQAVQAELEQSIKTEQLNVKSVTKLLKLHEQKHNAEKEQLQTKLTKESNDLQQLQRELDNERFSFQQEKEKLEYQLREQERTTRIQKRQMRQRHETIRNELTGLWQATKREARKEETRLRSTYQPRIEDATTTITQLRGEITGVLRERDTLQRLLGDATQEKNDATKKQEHFKKAYAQMMAKREETIVAMRENAKALQTTAETQREQITTYETSYRALAKASVHLTGKRLGSPIRGIRKRFFRKNNNNEQNQ